MTPNQKAAIEQALEALETVVRYMSAVPKNLEASSTALRAALAEQAELEAESEKLKQARQGTTWAKPCNFGGLTNQCKEQP